MSADGTKVSDQEILEWVERHDLRVSSATDARAAFEDARTLHLLAAVSRPAEARGDDAVLRETLAEALDCAPSSQLAYLALAAGAGQTLDLNKIVDALLAAAPRPEPGEVSEAMVDDAFLLAVEEEVGMGNGAWDMVKASDLCRAVLKVAALRAGTP